MSLSVITVTRNNAAGLADTLASIAALQALPDEVLVIDGASTDITPDVLKRFRNVLPLRVLSEPDQGIYDAMNKGLSLAHGDWLIFINAGDRMDAAFDVRHFLSFVRGLKCAVVGITLQIWAGDAYVRPSKGPRLLRHLRSPPHQGFFAPRAFYATERFTLDRPVDADRAWVLAAQRRWGTVFYPHVVASFELGGISNMPSCRSLKQRRREGLRSYAMEAVKLALRTLVGSRAYYRIIFLGKYTRLRLPHSGER